MSTRTTKITAQLLIELDACSDYREIFEALFPDGVEVTEELAAAYAMEFDWLWAIRNLLTLENSEKAEKLFEAEEAELEDGIAAARHKAVAEGWSPDAHRAFYAEIDGLRSASEITFARIFARLFIEQGGRPLLEGEPLPTSNGVVLTDEVLDALADEAERGYDIETLRPRTEKALTVEEAGEKITTEYTDALKALGTEQN